MKKYILISIYSKLYKKHLSKYQETTNQEYTVVHSTLSKSIILSINQFVLFTIIFTTDEVAIKYLNLKFQLMYTF